MELIINNWEYVLIIILSIDKIVALTPNTWDDLIWTSIKKAIFKVVGNNMFKVFIKKLVKKHGVKGLLILVGDIATKITPSKADDAVWKKIKKEIKKFSG